MIETAFSGGGIVQFDSGFLEKGVDVTGNVRRYSRCVRSADVVSIRGSG